MLVKDIVKVNNNEYSFTYINVVTNEKFVIHAKFDVKTNTVIIIKRQESVSVSLQTIKLPEMPKDITLTKEQALTNEEVIDINKYLSVIKPSFSASLT